MSQRNFVFLQQIFLTFMEYQPKPINVDMKSLPAELEGLVEALAENVHDQWTLERMRQGWTWGEHRDDDKKKHPGIVPYDMLTDDEKEVDRVTVRTVLSSLLTQGVTITVDKR